MVRSFLFLPISCVVLLVLSCATARNPEHCTPDERNLTVTLYQDGVQVPVRSGIAFLRKAPFTLEFEIADPGAILVSASSTSASRERVRQAANPYEAFVFNPNRGVREEPFNRDRRLMITDERFHCWYYSDAAHHRFDAVSRYRLSDPR